MIHALPIYRRIFQAALAYFPKEFDVVSCQFLCSINLQIPNGASSIGIPFSSQKRKETLTFVLLSCAVKVFLRSSIGTGVLVNLSSRLVSYHTGTYLVLNLQIKVLLPSSICTSVPVSRSYGPISYHTSIYLVLNLHMFLGFLLREEALWYGIPSRLVLS